MGYRSEVALMMKRDAYEKGKQWMEDNKICDKENPFYEFAEDTFIYPNGDILIYLDYVKWYRESYTELMNLYDFLESLDCESWSIMRVGEDYDDYEGEGLYYDDDNTPVLVRYLEFDNLDRCIPYKYKDMYYIKINV